MGRLALFWPALRNDPASGFPRRDEHELRSGAGAQPVGQGAVLNAPRGGYFTRTTHRRCTLLNAYLQRFITQAIIPGKLLPRGELGKKLVKLSLELNRRNKHAAATTSEPTRAASERRSRVQDCGSSSCAKPKL